MGTGAVISKSTVLLQKHLKFLGKVPILELAIAPISDSLIIKTEKIKMVKQRDRQKLEQVQERLVDLWQFLLALTLFPEPLDQVLLVFLVYIIKFLVNVSGEYIGITDAGLLVQRMKKGEVQI